MPSSPPLNTYAGNPLDRASYRRVDPAWIAERQADGAARVAVFWNGAPLVQDAAGDRTRLSYIGPSLGKMIAESESRWVFLGLDADEAAVFAIDIDAPADPAAGELQGHGRFGQLRELALQLSPDEAGIAATARAVFEWSRRTRYCGVCGNPTRAAEGGWKRICTVCANEHFPRTDPVVIMLPTQGERCLLGRQASWPPGRFSALAGFMEPGETIEEACARELGEEAKLRTLSVRYHSSQPWPFPANLMIGLFAEVAPGEATPDQTELEEVRWFSRLELAEVLAGRHEVKPPPPFAIAHNLIRAWAEGEAG
ncbi:MAG: NAD(+) diphosphatase [Caulobacteraceae bacterium]